MRQTNMGCADLHMHTTASDGTATVKELLTFIARERPFLDVIAITDHDTLDASLWAYEHRDDYAFDIVPGLEVSSRDGHVLALWVTQPIAKHMDLRDTVAAIHDAGGVAVLAHPFHVQMNFVRHNALRYWQHPGVLLEVELDAIEGHNAGVAIPGSNIMARMLAKRAHLPVIGNSDSHTLGSVGSGYTRFPGHDAVALRTAINNQRTQAEGGTWPITEYIEYLRSESVRRVIASSVKPT